VTLSAQSLSKRFGGEPGYDAVRDANLELRPGEFVAIVGRSGSGKSTLMAMLGALTRPSAGKVLLDGTDIWTLPEAELAALRARHIGFVFQFPSLLPNLSAVDNVALPALLGRTMAPEQAYARAYDLLSRIGLSDRADSYPGNLSGGEQRRVAIARALINAPALLLADEPTSDLDEDTEAEIIELLERLHRSERFSFVLVTHNLELARRAQRTYEMRQGALAASNLPQVRPDTPPLRHFGPPAIDDPLATPMAVTAPIHLGDGLWRGLQIFLLAAAVVLGSVLVADFGVEHYQSTRLRERAARAAALQHLALNSLRGDVQSVADLGEGRYELSTYLQNVGADPIYVMAPEMRAYVQVRTTWQEVPLRPVEDGGNGVLKIEGKQTYRYVLDARVRDFAQLLPNYMHVRFSGTMLVSPSSTPKDDVFERKDNYYVYLKPSDVSDEAIARRMRFSGKPPVWIPMPPH
jgi:ABC-type lipoprotein export system ATPase subunit